MSFGRGGLAGCFLGARFRFFNHGFRLGGQVCLDVEAGGGGFEKRRFQVGFLLQAEEGFFYGFAHLFVVYFRVSVIEQGKQAGCGPVLEVGDSFGDAFAEEGVVFVVVAFADEPFQL